MREQLLLYSQRRLSNMLMIGVATPTETVLVGAKFMCVTARVHIIMNLPVAVGFMLHTRASYCEYK